MNRPSWVGVQRDDGFLRSAGCCGESVSVASGLRNEPTLYYSDSDIRGYQSDLLARMNRIDVALRRLQSAALPDWSRTRIPVAQFTSAVPSGIGGVWTVPRSALAPSGLVLSITNKSAWAKGVLAEKTIEGWENVVAAATGQPNVPQSPGPRSWPDALAEASRAPERWAEAVVTAPGRAADATTKVTQATWEEVKPYAIGGAALVGLVALASLAKSVRG